jgi:uncharacterized protein (TIGR03084 family)
MLRQATDFRDESEALHRLLTPLEESEFQRKTLFRGWTINDVVGHLHLWNWAADTTLRDGDRFLAFLDEFRQQAASLGFRGFEARWLAGRRGRALLDEWRSLYLATAERYASADPGVRVRWAGPDMGVRSAITARLMETWAHGQAIYDLLRVERIDTDRIRNIAHLGVHTFGWTFRNRRLDVPPAMPHVRLTAPSGAIWEWGEDSDEERIEGAASDFCQVVTQTRNVADTRLRVVGATATQWMSIAQCFAGPPETPPAPGTRFVRRPR